MTQQELKIVLSGLDNAGKTSFLVALKKLYEYYDEVHNLKPTQRIDYFREKFLNLNLNIMDMGGQKKYREMYLKRPIYFTEVDVLIFLIDIQDETRFEEAIQYLEKVLDILKVESKKTLTLPINICFSKSDLSFTENKNEEFNSRIEMIQLLLKKRFNEWKFRFFYTSIYSIFSITLAISNSIREFNNLQNNIDHTLQKFIEKYKIENLCLFDKIGLLITGYDQSGNYISNNEGNYDKILSSHLGFSGMLKDDQIEVLSSKIIQKEVKSILYQFNLQDFEKIEENLQLSAHRCYDNFYLSVISNSQTDPNYEMKIPDLLNTIQNHIMNILNE